MKSELIAAKSKRALLGVLATGLLMSTLMPSFTPQALARSTSDPSTLQRCMKTIEQGVISRKKLPRQEVQSICECADLHDKTFKQGKTTIPSEVGLVLCAKDTMKNDWYKKIYESHGPRLRGEGWSSREIHWHALCIADASYEAYMDSMLQGSTPRQQLAEAVVMCYDRDHLNQR